MQHMRGGVEPDPSKVKEWHEHYRHGVPLSRLLQISGAKNSGVLLGYFKASGLKILTPAETSAVYTRNRDNHPDHVRYWYNLYLRGFPVHELLAVSDKADVRELEKIFQLNALPALLPDALEERRTLYAQNQPAPLEANPDEVAPPHRGRFSPGHVRELHQQYLAGKSASDLATQERVYLSTIYFMFARAGLKLQKEDEGDVPPHDELFRPVLGDESPEGTEGIQEPDNSPELIVPEVETPLPPSETPPPSPPAARPGRQKRQPLEPAFVHALYQRYTAGETITELAAENKINKMQIYAEFRTHNLPLLEQRVTKMPTPTHKTKSSPKKAAKQPKPINGLPQPKKQASQTSALLPLSFSFSQLSMGTITQKFCQLDALKTALEELGLKVSFAAEVKLEVSRE
jgi:hypothetical protein